ncbi:hypothetical protein CHY08_06770 [Rhizobium leguminosarum bv. viciae]|jgi:hypothetical protein|nr:hypothetical protein CHY08_06770 [Rhizobium leguminosarum bv. viciae]
MLAKAASLAGSSTGVKRVTGANPKLFYSTNIAAHVRARVRSMAALKAAHIRRRLDDGDRAALLQVPPLCLEWKSADARSLWIRQPALKKLNNAGLHGLPFAALPSEMDDVPGCPLPPAPRLACE